MIRLAWHRSRRLLPILALSGVAVAIPGPVSASTAPPSTPDVEGPDTSGAPEALPEGYVRLVDDTGFLTVVVPDLWDNVGAEPSSNDDGSPRPWIFASGVEMTEFNETFASGVLYVAAPYEDDPEAYLTDAGLSAGCESIEVEPYSDPIFTGFVQVGTNCGPDGGTWNMIAASPEDESFTAVVQLQISSPDEQEAFDFVLGSFTYAGDPSVPPGLMAPPATVPGGSVPG